MPSVEFMGVLCHNRHVDCFTATLFMCSHAMHRRLCGEMIKNTKATIHVSCMHRHLWSVMIKNTGVANARLFTLSHACIDAPGAKRSDHRGDYFVRLFMCGHGCIGTSGAKRSEPPRRLSYPVMRVLVSLGRDDPNHRGDHSCTAIRAANSYSVACIGISGAKQSNHRGDHSCTVLHTLNSTSGGK